MSQPAAPSAPFEGLPTLQAVRCTVCKALHDAAADSYFAVHGNIMIGPAGGIVGNNLDEEGRVTSASIYCRKNGCLSGLISAYQNPRP